MSFLSEILFNWFFRDIFEFKLNGTADEALTQIDEKGYAAEYSADSRKIFKIGCSFSSETGTVSDWKVA